MIIKGDKKYIDELVSLWQEVFLDDEEYIRLLFRKLYYEIECFAFEDEGKIVASLYLLKGEIKYNDKTYFGRYLYAAATKKQYRKKGIMSKLINEAVEYTKENGLDFICLLPANDKLYDYYFKFGFKSSMYKYVKKATGTSTSREIFKATNNSISKVRRIIEKDMFVFAEAENDYAYNALEYAGYKIYSLAEALGFESYAVADSEFSEAYECICRKENGNKMAKALSVNLSSGTEIFSPYQTDGAERIKNGMLYAINSELNGAEIYMNIALE